MTYLELTAITRRLPVPLVVREEVSVEALIKRNLRGTLSIFTRSSVFTYLVAYHRGLSSPLTHLVCRVALAEALLPLAPAVIINRIQDIGPEKKDTISTAASAYAGARLLVTYLDALGRWRQVPS